MCDADEFESVNDVAFRDEPTVVNFFANDQCIYGSHEDTVLQVRFYHHLT